MDNNMHIVTEVGVFGDLNIEDPTAKKVKKKNEELSESEVNQLIEESVQANASIKY